MIEEAAKASGRSVRSLAANAGISDTRWRQVVKGWQPGPGGDPIPVRAPALTLARMAWAVGADGIALAEAGRVDAADLLDKLQAGSAGSGIPMPAAGGGVDFVYSNNVVVDTNVFLHPHHGADEIDMIYASNMPAREKLLRIRQVLELRAKADAEEAQTHGKAPAEPAGAEDRDTSESR